MQSFPGYTILEQVGETLQSNVFRARKEGAIATVIIKALKTEHPSPAEIARFKHEYELIRHLNIDGVIKTIDLIESADDIALVMEDFDAVSLKKAMRRGFTLEQFLDLAVRLAETLGKVHQSDIIHRDIKPLNILVNKDEDIVRITDFGIAAEIAPQNREIYNSKVIQGTLVYISPEQTGRMNCSVDSRSDLYSLGVTFYEILTGILPFVSDDPMEVIHGHIAKSAMPPAELNPEIPKPVSDIVVKLLAKSPEERYQNSFGLMADLRRCLDQLQQSGEITSFELGTQDFPLRFNIPSIMVGRENELALLNETFERVSKGGTEIVLVSGEPGIGKSAVVNELQKPVIGKHGYFITGKFDQYRKSVPYSAIIQAFQGLVRELLTESEERLQQWRKRLLHALGPNGQIITNVIPDLELIIGHQPDIPDLGPTETQNRFNYVFKNFVRLFADPEHPLVLFLDDLHWADSASLQFIQTITAGRSLAYFFLIGTYRDNEVATHHPLMLALENIRKAAVPIGKMTLDSLEVADVTRLVAGFLRTDTASCESLAAIIYDKTRGNPFFVIEFLKNLYEQKILSLNPGEGWSWDLRAIQKMQMTDNVVELLAGKIASLPQGTKELIEVCACMGNHFDIESLCAISGKAMDEILAAMAELIHHGFIYYSENQYRFYHDRIQEAAYSLLLPQAREKLHYQIGRRELKHATQEQISKKIFYITDQLNQARGQIDNLAQKNELAHLNLEAAIKAMESTAYGTAASYLQAGIELLPADTWASQYDLSLSLYMKRIQCEYQNRQFDEAERLFAIIIENAKTRVERAYACISMIQLYTNIGKFTEALALGLDSLESFGVHLSKNAGKLAVIKELLGVKLKLRKIAIEDCVDLPKMTNEEKIVVAELLAHTALPVHYTKPNLWAALVLRGINNALVYGYTHSTPFAFASLAAICVTMGDYALAFRAGEMSMKLIDKLSGNGYDCKTTFLFGYWIHHWARPIKNGLEYFRRAYQLGLDSGDFLYSGLSVTNLIMNRIIGGDPVDDILAENQRYDEFIAGVQDSYLIKRHALARQYCLNIKGMTETAYSLNGKAYDEASQLAEMRQQQHQPYIFCHLLAREKIAYLHEHYEAARKDGDELDTMLKVPVGNTWGPEHAFYRCLTLLALYPQQTHAEKRRFLKIIKQLQKKIRRWADNAPENFLHKYLLVEAETAALTGRTLEAIDLYHQAVQSARQNDYIQNEAIANERAAKFHLSRGYEEIARAYMTSAYHAFRRWGATAKLAALEEAYPSLIVKAAKGRALDTSLGSTDGSRSLANTSSMLDISTIMKASQAISGEVMLDRLLHTVMDISITSAGAEWGVLILNTDGKRTIEASQAAESDEIQVMQGIPLETYDGLCTAIVNYVFRSGKSLIIGNASQQGAFINDPYIIKKQCKSILCGPIISQGKVSGVLYLENNLTANAFTPERIELMQFLSTQAAISIENAKLFQQATIDGLTKLYVVRYFRVLLDQEISRSLRYDRVFSVVMTDIDYFKQFNDTYGHQLGDEVLRKVAQALKNSARAVDVVARYGGEEFIIILPETDMEGVKVAAEKFRKIVEDIEIKHLGETLNVTISLGTATYSKQLANKEALIKVADRALYRSKEQGRNRVTIGEEIDE